MYFLPPFLLGRIHLTTREGGGLVSDFCSTYISLSGLFVFCLLLIILKHEGKQEMKAKLRYSSWFLIFTDIKLLPASRACSAWCRLPHGRAGLWMQGAWNTTMWKVMMKCRWCCSFLRSRKTFLLSQHFFSIFPTHQMQPLTTYSGSFFSVAFTWWILSPMLSPMLCWFACSCLTLTRRVKLP